MPAKLKLVTSTTESQERFLQKLLANNMEQFAVNLVLAHTYWKKYRTLVEADEMPEPFKSVFAAGFDGEYPWDEEAERDPRSKEACREMRRIARTR